MLDIPDAIPFNRGAVQPMECLRSGWALIKDQYWMFVGMCLVAILIGSAVPLGIMLGPMMCGIYLAIFQHRRGEPVEFGVLFKGFDFLGESIIATLIHVVPIFVILVPFYIAFYVGLFLIMPRGGETNPGSLIGFFALFFVFLMIVLVLVILISVLFTFTYPLIVDRRLSGVNAVKLSAKAALANFWQLLGLMLITSALGVAGVLLCYIGIFLVFPVTFAALATAYEQVFGIANMQAAPGPPPPPTFN
ncbi:MAG: hypothetical protein ABI967_05315 [bacterium]